MRIHVFTPGYNEGNAAVLRAFADAVGAKHSDDRRYVECDVAVIFGLVKKRNPLSYSKGEIMRRHKGKPLLVIERGFVQRERYYSVGWNGINGKADFVNEDVDEKRWKALGTPLKRWRTPSPIPLTLVCGQVPWDVTVQDTDHKAWCQDVVHRLMALRRNPIFRPHPYVRNSVKFKLPCKTSREDLKTDLARCTHVVTYCSNTAVDAVIEGIPTFSFSDMSMAWDVTSHDLRQPIYPDRTLWAHRIAHAQWKVDEFASAWAQVKRRLQ